MLLLKMLFVWKLNLVCKDKIHFLNRSKHVGLSLALSNHFISYNDEIEMSMEFDSKVQSDKFDYLSESKFF